MSVNRNGHEERGIDSHVSVIVQTASARDRGGGRRERGRRAHFGQAA
jgi:hypothetical protein